VKKTNDLFFILILAFCVSIFGFEVSVMNMIEVSGFDFSHSDAGRKSGLGHTLDPFLDPNL
jgi:hypothetical protein